MKVTGKIYLFANKKEINGKTITDCTTNVTDQDDNGNVRGRFYHEVRFAGSKAPSKEQVAQLKENTMYEIEIKDGFLGCRSYKGEDGKTHAVSQIVILDCSITDSKKVMKKDTKRKAKPKKAKPIEDEDCEEDDEAEEMPF